MKRIHWLSLTLALCLLLTACGGGNQSKPEKTDPDAPPEPEVTETADPLAPSDTTLVIAIQDEVEGLDVQQIGYANIVHYLIYEPPVAYNPDLTEVVPAFVEDFTITDEYYEFVLPADAKFSNGNKLDAEAFKASVERYIEISEYAGDLDAVSSVEVMDERTVRFNLSTPAGYTLANLTTMFGGIVDVSEVAKIGEWEFNRKPVGNGAYYVEDWVAGSHLVLKRNEYFHTNNPSVKNHNAPNFETIIVRFIPDADERMDELEAGRVDFAYNAPTSLWELLDKDPAYNVWSYQQPGVCYLNLQTEKGALADARVREAMTYAIDRDEIVKGLGGVVTPTYGFLVPAQTGYSAAEEAILAERLKYDPERARALLAEAGWADADGDGILDKDGEPLHVSMLVPSDHTSFRAAGPALVEQFRAIGMDAEVHYFEADYIKELMRSDEYEIGSRAYEWIDADILYWCFSGEASYHWDDPVLDELLTKARFINDMDERVDAYVAVSERLAGDFKAISLFADNYIIVSKANVSGLVTTLDERVWFNDVVKN